MADSFEIQKKKISKKLVKFHFESREPCPVCELKSDLVCGHCGRKHAVGEVEFESWVYDRIEPIEVKSTTA